MSIALEFPASPPHSHRTHSTVASRIVRFFVDCPALSRKPRDKGTRRSIHSIAAFANPFNWPIANHLADGYLFLGPPPIWIGEDVDVTVGPPPMWIGEDVIVGPPPMWMGSARAPTAKTATRLTISTTASQRFIRPPSLAQCSPTHFGYSLEVDTLDIGTEHLPADSDFEATHGPWIRPMPIDSRSLR